MEKMYEPKNQEYYENLLEIVLEGIDKIDLSQQGNYVFCVNNEFKVLISDKTHLILANKNNFTLDTTLVDGYIKMGIDGKKEVDFKPELRSNFKGSDYEFAQLKKAAEKKILELVK